jgi:hypothetical protein
MSHNQSYWLSNISLRPNTEYLLVHFDLEREVWNEVEVADLGNIKHQGIDCAKKSDLALITKYSILIRFANNRRIPEVSLMSECIHQDAVWKR